jgi:HD-like signal output (HDOD) protein
MSSDSASHASRGLTPEKIVREVKNLPAAPKVLPKLRALLADGNSSLQEIVALIRIEPGMAARVLQISNSAGYGGSVRCADVDEAVNRVGFAQVYELVMHAVASQVLVRPLTTYNLEADASWRQSVVCGLAAEILAEHLGEEHEEAYTLGLLNGIGMVAIDGWALRHFPSLGLARRPFPKEYTASERALLGFTHADVGALLLKQWEFSPPMVEALRLQYSPWDGDAGRHLGCVLHASKWLQASLLADEDDSAPAPLREECLEELKIDENVLRTLLPELETRVAEMKALADLKS